MKALGAGVGLLAVSVVGSHLAYAQDFDGEYVARTGQLTGDGLLDIYLDKRPRIVFVDVGDIPTPIVVSQREVGQFVLENQGNGTFVATPINVTQAAAAAQWTQQPIELEVADRNFDGHKDIQLNNMEGIIPGALDHVVFAPATKGSQPVQVTPLTDYLTAFSAETLAWAIDPLYFQNNAPLKLTGSHPGSANYYGTVFNPTSWRVTNRLVADCEFYTGRFCGVSTADPSPCLQQLTPIDEYGNTGQPETVNACLYDTHVWAFTPGSATFAPDYSRFNPHARAFAAAIENNTPNHDIDDLKTMPAPDVQVLNDILRGIIREVYGQNGPGDVPQQENSLFFQIICGNLASNGNSVSHSAFPLDTFFQQFESDPTYHHYDANTRICSYGENQCTDTIITNEILRRFSYPSFRLQPRITPLDATTAILVYLAPPNRLNRPSAYMVPFGYVIQYAVNSPDWPNAIIQNLTTPVHLVYPGTINRTVGTPVPDPAGPHIFTHGLGVNRGGTLWAPPGIPSQPVNMILGCANDLFGSKVFSALDKQAAQWWRDHISTSQINSPAAAEGAFVQ